MVCMAMYDEFQDGLKQFTYPRSGRETKVGKILVGEERVGEWPHEILL